MNKDPEKTTPTETRQMHISAGSATADVPARWDIETQITKESAGTFAVNIRIFCTLDHHSADRRLPPVQGFHTATDAAAFTLSWVSEWKALNEDA